MKASFPTAPRILITRTDRIGDLVVSTPVFEMLKKIFPQSYLAACVFSEHRELVEAHPFLDEVIAYDKKGAQSGLFGQWSFACEIKSKKFDAVIHLHATNRMHMMGFFAGIPLRVGYNRRAPWALTHVFDYDKKEGLKHESEYLAELIAGLTGRKENLPLPLIAVTVANKLSVSNLFEHAGIKDAQKIAVIHPSASDESKMWPAEKFAALLKKNEYASYRWIAVGDDKAEKLTEEIRRLSGFPVYSLCGQLSLGMLAAVFQKAALVLSNDSGPAHIAAAVGTPTVSIFGRWQPGLNAERWHPRGRKTASVIPQIDSIPVAQRTFTYIDSVTVEQVDAAVKEVTA